MSRKKARISALKLLYAMDITKEYNVEMLNSFVQNFELSDDSIEYLDEAFDVILENLQDIDEVISRNLKDWKIERLSYVDRQILRICVYEMIFREDIPKEVSINEAVQISKEYSSSDAPRFINGILGSIYKYLEDEYKG